MYDANEINEEKDAWFATAGINVKELYFCFVYKHASALLLGSFTRAFIQGYTERMALLTTQETLHDVDTRHA